MSAATGQRMRPPDVQTLVSAFDLLNHLVKPFKEPGPVPRFKRPRPTADEPFRAKLLHKIPRGESITDIIAGEEVAGWGENPCPGLDAQRCKRDICRYHDVILGSVLDDPVVGGVQLIAHDDRSYRLLLGNAHPGVRDERHVQVVTPRHFADFLFDRTGIGINV